ncbi:MAG: hypothetical protein Fur0025_24070 [Oscillatoriaceae cyanobacterium]
MMQPGMLLNQRYRVVKFLGKGGFSEIWEVTDRDQIKVIKVLNLAEFYAAETQQKALALFQREAKVLMGLNHPGIPQVEPDGYFTYTTSDGELHHCLVQEKIEGENLQDWRQRGDKIFTEAEAIDWLKQLTEILIYLHDRHYFHRDIKPANIMVKPNGQLVLIDFGTVREITPTYLATIVEDREVTRLGSVGYAPPEQYQGKSLPQSDFYALGRTFVYLFTGQPPDLIPETELGELMWRELAPEISPQLADVMDWLMATFPRARPQHPEEILHRLAAIKTTDAPSFSKFLPSNLKTPIRRSIRQPLLNTVVITALIIGARQLGMLQSWELQTFDQLLRLRPDEKPESRILIVQATEEDIKRYGYPLPDAILAQVIEKLEPYQPRVIGVNILRDRPVGDNPTALVSHWRNNSKLIAACLVKDPNTPNRPGVAPPKDIPTERIGFGNVVVDSDGILRRHLIFMPKVADSPCQSRISLSFQLAMAYLATEGIKPQNTPQDYVQFGSLLLKPLKVNRGFYPQAQLSGFQLLLNYHSSPEIDPSLTISQVLTQKIPPHLVKNRLIIIGMNTASSYTFTTLMRDHNNNNQEISDLILHAQMASQIIRAAKGERPLLSFGPNWFEILWIGGWVALTYGLGCSASPRKNIWLFRLTIVARVFIIQISLVVVSVISMTGGLVVPLVPTTIALITIAAIAIIRRDDSPNKSRRSHPSQRLLI